LRPALPTLPTISIKDGSSLIIPPTSEVIVADKRDSQFVRFCKTLRSIENERLKQRENIQVCPNVPTPHYRAFYELCRGYYRFNHDDGSERRPPTRATCDEGSFTTTEH
jgi:hypothetical protein